ncbi:MAG: TadE/TadG family type IV pilus assembly protein [Gemmatimonadota bacterium]
MTRPPGAGSKREVGRKRRGRSRLKDRGGQALAEFVLVVPVLLLLVFGIVEFGLAFRTHQIVTNTAREGARVAVLPTGDDAGVIDVVEDRLSSSGLDPAAATITLRCDGAGETLCTGDRAGRLSDVEIAYPYQFFVLGGLVGWVCGAGCDDGYGTIQLRTTSSMRNE